MTEFGSIEIAALPAPVKSANAETIALGTALLAAITDTAAALDPTTYADRKEATKRAAALKRAAAAADKSRHVTSRVYAEDGAWRVAIMNTPPKTESSTPAASGKGKG